MKLKFKGGVQAGDVNLGASSTLLLFQAMSLEEVMSVLREEERSEAEWWSFQHLEIVLMGS